MAEALRASVRYEAAYTERARYNKAYYSLDADDGIEYSACLHELTPDEVLELKVVIRQLWNLSPMLFACTLAVFEQSRT